MEIRIPFTTIYHSQGLRGGRYPGVTENDICGNIAIYCHANRKDRKEKGRRGKIDAVLRNEIRVKERNQMRQWRRRNVAQNRVYNLRRPSSALIIRN
jgi:hypothetical protein